MFGPCARLHALLRQNAPSNPMGMADAALCLLHAVSPSTRQVLLSRLIHAAALQDRPACVLF